MFEIIVNWLVNLVFQIGYLGVLIALAIESTFIPLPSEVILLPAGYLIFTQGWNPLFVILAAVIGSIIGSYFTYFLGEKLGRPFFKKYGKYFFLPEKRFEKVENFFNKYGATSVFLGRLTFGVRHFISFPAGITKMNKIKFISYTALGSFIWCSFLVLLGYFIGTQIERAKGYILWVTVAVISIALILLLIFIFRTYFEFEGLKIKRKKRNSK